MTATRIAPTLLLLLGSGQAWAQPAPGITDIYRFLDRCPTEDAAILEILVDFTIRVEGQEVSTFPCTSPISLLPIEHYSDALIALQGLRTIYYMDRGRAGHLPWTPGTMYDWMRGRIQGIDIRSGAGIFCCVTYEDGLYFVVEAGDELNRDFDRRWRGISSNIGLYGHEVRHADGFVHASCCETAGSCDQTYDEAALSSNGIQYWFERAWLTGELPVGFSCGDPADVQENAFGHAALAELLQSSFCDVQPPDVTIPPDPGGTCQYDTACATAFGQDADVDRVDDACDNCRLADNAGQTDFDADGIGDVCENGAVLADANNSGRVDGFDLALMGRVFGARQGDGRYVAGADLDRNRMIDGEDLAILASEWGRSIG